MSIASLYRGRHTGCIPPAPGTALGVASPTKGGIFRQLSGGTRPAMASLCRTRGLAGLGTVDYCCARSYSRRSSSCCCRAPNPGDSLSERVAHDARVMPALNVLLARGVALQVSPCRDQLTFLCLRALLTGYDQSSLLALLGNFTHVRAESDNLFDRLAQAGRRVNRGRLARLRALPGGVRASQIQGGRRAERSAGDERSGGARPSAQRGRDRRQLVQWRPHGARLRHTQPRVPGTFHAIDH